MGTFTVKFETDNAAFGNTPEVEIARVLKEIASRVENKGCPGVYETIRDYNGNTIGQFKLDLNEGE